MVTPSLSTEARLELAEVFDALHQVELLDSNDVERLHLLRRPELGVTFTKLCLWTLTQYERVVYLDADTLVLKNVDDLFARDEFSAAPDIGWPDCFNSGVFVARPSLETYDALLRRAQVEGSFDGGDQGLLNQHFTNWNRLPFLYNVVPGTFYSYSPAYRHYLNDIKIVHFIGPLKPWKSGRPAQGVIGEGHDLQAYWWNVYDAHRGGRGASVLLAPYSSGPSTITGASAPWLGRFSGAPSRSSSSSSSLAPIASPLRPSPWERAQTPSGEAASFVIDFQNYPHSAVDEKTLIAKVEAVNDPKRQSELLESIREELWSLNSALKSEGEIEDRAPGTIDSIHDRATRLTHVLMKFKFYGK